MARRHSKIIYPKCSDFGGTITSRNAGNAKTKKYFYIKHYDNRAKHKSNPCYIGRPYALAYIVIVGDRYSTDYEKNIRSWSVRNREVDVKENLNLTRNTLDLLVDMGFPEGFVVQKFVADMGRIFLEVTNREKRYRDLSEDFDSNYDYGLLENYRISRHNFKAFIRLFNELYKDGAAVKRLDEYKKSYFEVVT